MLSFPEVHELSEEVRQVFEELDRVHGHVAHGASGMYTPPIDVVETETAVEVFVDLPGVAPDSVRVFFKHGSLVIAGEKLAPESCPVDGTAFHLVERGFGRFARVVRLSVATDAGRATAALVAGELRVSVPRLAERRGCTIAVPIARPAQ